MILSTQFMKELKAPSNHMLNLDDEIDEMRCMRRLFPSLSRSDAGLLIRRDPLSKYSLTTTILVKRDIGTMITSAKNELTRSLDVKKTIHEIAA